MFAAIFFAATFVLGQLELSAEARSAISPVLDAIAAERAAQAKLPAPKHDAEKLVRLGRLDQAPRTALARVDFSRAPEAELQAVQQALIDAIRAVDRETEAELLKLVPPEGWFARSKYGEEGERAAFQIIQHSNAGQWRRFLPVIERFVAQGEASGQAYALMYDRLAISEGRPQRYGSQSRCEHGKLVPFPLEDPGRVEAWRMEARLAPTFAEEIARFSKAQAPC